MYNFVNAHARIDGVRQNSHVSACGTGNGVQTSTVRSVARARYVQPSRSGHTGHVYEAVSWEAVEEMVANICASIADNKIDVVLAVTRGGMVPATLICEALEFRNLVTATVIFYTDAGEQFFGLTQPRFLQFPSVDQLCGRRVLIVDDVWDTGRTACAVRERVVRADAKTVQVAVLHFKPSVNEMDEQPNYYASVTSNWIVYPWERCSPHAPSLSTDAINGNGADTETRAEESSSASSSSAPSAT